MDKNTNLRGEAYWHVLLDEQCHIKDMINVQLPFPIEEKDWSIFYNLMNTDVINTEELELSNGKCYLFMYDGSPAPAAYGLIVWRFVRDGKDRLFVDVDHDVMRFFAETGKHFYRLGTDK